MKRNGVAVMRGLKEAWEQSHDLTVRNRIQGRTGRTSGQMIAKSISIKGQGCKFGRCVVKAAVLTSGGLGLSPNPVLRGRV